MSNGRADRAADQLTIGPVRSMYEDWWPTDCLHHQRYETMHDCQTVSRMCNLCSVCFAHLANFGARRRPVVTGDVAKTDYFCRWGCRSNGYAARSNASAKMFITFTKVKFSVNPLSAAWNSYVFPDRGWPWRGLSIKPANIKRYLLQTLGSRLAEF